MKFTIAIPTRNRASLLPHALKSALNQDFDDYQILVSNNCSDDETESIVSNFVSSKIRYIKTDYPMSMVDHFNFVFDHIEGEWAFFLCDDDALVPYALKFMDGLISQYPKVDIFSTIAVIYTYPDYKERQGNSLSIPGNLNNKVYIRNSTSVLKSSYQNLTTAFPKAQTSFIKTSIYESIRKKYGKAFFRWAPDASNGLLILANTPHFAFIRTPILIWGESYHSYGRGPKVDPSKLYEFYNEFEEFNGQIEHTPHPGLIAPTVGLYATFCMVREMLDANVRKKLIIDQHNYLKNLIPYLRRFVDEGFDDYAAYLKTIESDLSKITNAKSKRKEISGSALQLVKKLARNLGLGKKVISGDNSALPFNNILESTYYIDSHFRPTV